MRLAAVSSRLPVEVISLVFDWVDLVQLLLASHVCAKWRAVARSHPLFWRNIRLGTVSTPALDFFEARLLQTTEASIEITVELADTPLGAHLQSVILPAIEHNLRRLRLIRLQLHSEVAPLLMRLLSNPAPRLERLTLIFHHLPEGQSSTLLPSDLFAGTCPKLKVVALTSVCFPTQPIRAFDHVQSLLYNFGSPQKFDFGLFDHFPALASLTLFGESCLGTDHPWTSSRMPMLSLLEVHIGRCDYDSIFYSIPNLAEIPVIQCRQPHEELTQLFFTHLEGEIAMDFLCGRRDLIYISLYAPSSRRMRTLIEFGQYVLEDWPRDVLFDAAFVKRVTTLRIYAQLMHLTPHFEELPACHTLAVVVDDTEFPPTPSAPAPALRLPALKTVVLELAVSPSAQPRTVSVSAVSAFLALLVGERQKHPVLELEGISLSGDRETLRSAFELKSAPTTWR